jgi:MFS family permease
MSAISRWRRVAPVVAIAFGVLTLGVAIAGPMLDGVLHRPGPGGPVADWLTTAVPLVSAATVGTLVAVRRPRNPIGWIILAIFLLAAAPDSQYAILDYRIHHGRLPFGWVAVALLGAWPLFLALIAILLWLFPDGRLPTGRWRRLSVILVAAGSLLALAVSTGLVVAVAGHAMPVNASGNLIAKMTGAWKIPQRALGVMFIALLAGSFLAWLVVQIPTYRRSASERRQQLKWLYSGAIIFVISFFIPGQVGNDWIGPLGAAALPVCIGVAVLKYRLYEIDRIISRVISYALITAVLAGVFAGLVLLATEVLPFKTPVAVAASTLAAAALFNPLRTRVQRMVDRRFNRARYNAEAVVAAFTARLRQTVDLDAAQGDLIDTVHRAFEPAHASVWLTGIEQPAGRRNRADGQYSRASTGLGGPA